MSATQVLAATGSAFAVIVAAITIWRVFRPWVKSRRDRAARLDDLLYGKPDQRDLQDKVIEPGHPAISVQLRDLHDIVSGALTPNGGSSIADRVSRIDRTVSDLRDHQQEIETVVREEAVQIEEARRLAGQAATIADRVDQRHTDDLHAIDVKVDSIEEKVEELRQITRDRLEAAEMKAEAMRDIAVELGMPWPEDAEDDE